MLKSRLLIALLTCTLLLMAIGCNDDDDNCVAPDTDTAPTMANIWPHADGNAWTFEGTYAEYPVPETPAVGVSIKALPTMEELHTALQQAPTGEPLVMVDGLYRVAFDGIVTTDTGVSAQQVRETFYMAAPLKSDRPAMNASEAPDHLLRLIARARPDLRDAIVEQLDLTNKELVVPSPPMFLGGYAFSAEENGYYGYGDLDANHSWKYLESSLAVGTEFSIQLVPVLADNIWLYGKIWSQGELTVGGVLFKNVVECMYLVDLGESTATDENGVVIGTTHGYLYGTTHYAPDVGPIRARERHNSLPDNNLQDSMAVTRDYVMDLVGATAAN